MATSIRFSEIDNFCLDRGKYYYLLPWGIGDALVVCGYAKALEHHLGAPIHFLIKAQHIVIMDMYQWKEYTCVEQLNANKQETKDWLQKLGGLTPTPSQGRIYVAHPDFLPCKERFLYLMANPGDSVNFRNWYCEFLGLQPSTKWEVPNEPMYHGNVIGRVERTLSCKVEDMVLLLPEANSSPQIPMNTWASLVSSNSSQNITMAVSIVNPQKCHGFESLPNLKLNLQELLQVGMRCRAVYALRSGLCDLLAMKGPDLHVYYPSRAILNVFSLNRLFNRADIDEILCPTVENIEDYLPIIPKTRITKRVDKNFYFLGIKLFTIKREVK